MTIDRLQEVAAECGMPRFAARQMADWLYVKRIADVDDMTNLSKKPARRYHGDIVWVVPLPRLRPGLLTVQ